MKALVTGAAGFIGSHLCERLIADGFQVIGLDNLSTGTVRNLDSVADNANFKFCFCDLLDTWKVSEVLDGVEVVFHLAANSDVRNGVNDTSADIDDGIMATRSLLEAMREAGVKEIVYASSSTVYGEAKIIPTLENYGPLLPISLYGASKLAGEALISAYCGTFEFSAAILRFCNIIGVRSSHGIIPDIIGKLQHNPSSLEILGDGTQEKPYMHVSDCVDCIMEAYGSYPHLAIYNISPKGTISADNIIFSILDAMKLTGKTKLRYAGGGRGWVGDVPLVCLDNRNISFLVRDIPTSEDAVKRTIKEILDTDQKEG